jgi:leucyl aminopeptidase (aminopeptidase T)
MLFELPSGRTELSTLTATGGIEYKNKDKEFIGSELFYDHQAAVIKVKGDKSRPCYYNGILVDGIEMNLKTGKVKKVKAEIVGPGTIQMNRNQP